MSFVANLPDIDIILSGMAEVEHIIANINTIKECNEKKIEYSAVFYENLKNSIAANNTVGCTSCEYCLSACPKKIKIPNILSIINSYSNQGKNDLTAIGRYNIFYNAYIKMGRAGDCIDCGRCESRCPQKLRIRDYLKMAVRLFEGGKKSMFYYSAEKNIQMLIYLMKQHGVKKVIISPGTLNAGFSYSIQQDGEFEVYSAADERSAAYMACGLAAETGKPVALSCTGATASRNYLPGLTEAYYRKLPVLAITSTPVRDELENLFPQHIDRSVGQKDIVNYRIYQKAVHTYGEKLRAETNLNRALLMLTKRGGGPVHIDLETEGTDDYSVRVLPKVRTIRYIDGYETQLPTIKDRAKIGIFIGAHKCWTDNLERQVDLFCKKYNAIVICDHTSNYKGSYGVLGSLLFSQDNSLALKEFDLLIHMGQVSGAYLNFAPLEVWRVSEDGEAYDTFRKLTYVFDMRRKPFLKSIMQTGLRRKMKVRL